MGEAKEDDRENLPAPHRHRDRGMDQKQAPGRSSHREGHPDTTWTLEGLKDASAEDWLGSDRSPDVMLSVPNVGVDHIGLTVKDLRAQVTLHAKVLDLLELSVGADVSLQEIDLDIDNVRVQAMLKVDLERVVQVVDRVMTTIDNNPEILTNLTQGIGKGVEGALSQGSTDRQAIEGKSNVQHDQRQETRNERHADQRRSGPGGRSGPREPRRPRRKPRGRR